MHFLSSLFSLFLFFSLFFQSGKATCEDKQNLNISADGYQYSDYSINPFEGYYKEWWFFTASDSTADVAWCMGYSVNQPDNKKERQSGLAGMFWPNFQKNSSNIINIQDVYDYSDFSASTENATVSVGTKNNIKVLNETTYLVEGSTKDGSLQWNLIYHQVVPACRELMQIAIVQLDWISFMPTALVTGYFIYNENKIPVNARGYHDHNWGVWPTSDFNWIWAQYGDASQDFALVMGAYNVLGTNEYIGYVFLRINGEKTKIGTLCLDSYSLVPLEFQEWEGHKFSVKNKVEVKGEEYWLEMEYAAISSGPNPGGIGLNLLVFEQISQFNVTLSQSDGKGGWNQIVQSVGLGFNEWSDIIKK